MLPGGVTTLPILMFPLWTDPLMQSHATLPSRRQPSDDGSCVFRTPQMNGPPISLRGGQHHAVPVATLPGFRGANMTLSRFCCRAGNITLFSPLQRVNQYPTQFFRIDFHGLTAEKNPLYLFNLTGAKQ